MCVTGDSEWPLWITQTASLIRKLRLYRTAMTHSPELDSTALYMALHSFGVSSDRDSAWNIHVCGEDWIIDESKPSGYLYYLITPLIEVPYINDMVQDVTLMTAGIGCSCSIPGIGTFRWAEKKPDAGIGKWRIELLHLLVFISFCRHSPLQWWKQTFKVSNAPVKQGG